MKISELHISNFYSIGSATLSLADSGLVGIFGQNKDVAGATSNGSGKSTIWDALSWVLYGKVPREYEGDEVVRLNSKGGCWVEVEFIIDGQEWCIERYRKHPKYKNELHLWCGDNEVSALTTADTQAKIVKLLGMDYQTFAVCIAFGQDTLRFAKATDKEQKAILDRILGTEQYELAYKEVLKMQSQLEKDIQSLSRDGETAAATIAENKETMKALEASNKKLKEEREVFKKNCEEKIKILQAELNDAPAKRVLLEKKRDEWQAKRDTAQTKVGKDNSGLIRSMENEITLKMAEVDGLESQVEDLNSDAESIKATNKKCRACKQTINEEEYNRQLSFAEGARDKMQSGLERLIAECDTFVTKKKAEIKKLQEEQETFKLAQAELNTAKSELTRAIIAVDAQKDRERNLTAQISEFTIRRDARVADNSATIFKICEERIAEAKIKRDAATTDRAAMEELLDGVNFWVKGFGPGGVRSFIIDSMVPYLTERAQYYADALLDGSIQIVFNTQKVLKSKEIREQFEVQVINAYGANIYKGNSAGEKQRIDFCVALALYDLARTRAKCPIELVVFDEAFERLDDAGTDRIIRLLRKESKNWKSCFVTTHDADLGGHFDNRITVIKEKGESRIITNMEGVPNNGKKNRKNLETKSRGME